MEYGHDWFNIWSFGDNDLSQCFNNFANGINALCRLGILVVLPSMDCWFVYVYQSLMQETRANQFYGAY